MASKEKISLDLPQNKEILLRIFYKIAVMKGQSMERKNVEHWISQIIGCFYSCDLYNPWRKLKKKFNYKKKGKK